MENQDLIRLFALIKDQRGRIARTLASTSSTTQTNSLPLFTAAASLYLRQLLAFVCFAGMFSGCLVRLRTLVLGPTAAVPNDVLKVCYSSFSISSSF